LGEEVREVLHGGRSSDPVKAIGDARGARIPENLRGLRERIERVYARADEAKRNGVRSLRPGLGRR
jgi:hypothetical protein